MVALVLAVVIGIGTTVTSAVYSSLPPYYLRQELSNAKLELAKARSSASELAARVKQQDDDWQNRRAELIQKAKDEEQQKITAARQVLAKDETSLQADPDKARVFTIGIGVFLLLVWTWADGFAIELFSMGFYLSNDVKNIRSELEKPRARGAAVGAAQ